MPIIDDVTSRNSLNLIFFFSLNLILHDVLNVWERKGK